MASEILQKYGTIVKPTSDWESLGNNTGWVSAEIDNTSVRAGRARIHARFKTGTSPTAGASVKFYLIARSNDGTTNLSSAGVSGANVSVSAEPVNAKMIASVQVSATSNVVYDVDEEVFDLPAKYAVVIWNASGVALNSSTAAADKQLQVVPNTDESQ